MRADDAGRGEVTGRGGRTAGAPVLPLSTVRVRRSAAGAGAGGIVAVATRAPVRVRLSAVSAALGLAPPLFVPRLEAALEGGVDRGVLFVDLAECAAEPDLVALVRTWDAFRPGTEVVLFTPLVDRDCELRAVVGVCRGVRSAEVRVMTASDFYRDDVWRNVREMREAAALEAEFRSEFLAAVRRAGRPLRAEPAVLLILHDAPRAAGCIRASAVTPLGDVRVRAPAERKALWKALRRSGQLPASWLVLVFRVLWHRKLTDLGWPAARVAAFLGFDSPRRLRLTIKRRFGVGLAELRQVRYEHALAWAADLVTTSHVRLAGQPVRDLIAPLLARPAAPPPRAPLERPPILFGDA